MEKFGNNCGGREFVDGFDVEANKKLNGEIAELRAQGYKVRVGEKSDPAYDNPEKIEKVYSYLEIGLFAVIWAGLQLLVLWVKFLL